MTEPLILAIETSCDDTAAAVVQGTTVRSNIVSSQDIHNLHGGIVPELASREHVKAIAPIVQLALAEAAVNIDDVDAIAVTYGPGLPGSLVVGSHYAKGLSLRLGKPLYPVHHIEAHMYSGHLEDPTLGFPALCLVVSGGHTSIFLLASLTDYRILGSTRDDAAGEAFDKIAKMLGLGYPGGPYIDRLARDGDAAAIAFPRGLHHEPSYDFSFSGLKTAVRYYLQRTPDGERRSHADIAASAQQAIVDVLVHKTMRAAVDHGVRAVVIAGGVSANSLLRTAMRDRCSAAGMHFVAPRPMYSVDNAAMIGFLAAQRLAQGSAGRQTLDFGIEAHALRAR